MMIRTKIDNIFYSLTTIHLIQVNKLHLTNGDEDEEKI